MAPSPPDLIPPPSLTVLSNPNLRQVALEEFLKNAGLLLLPALALSALFFSSTKYTEAITKKKYSTAYDAYQKRVGMFLPFKAIVTELAGNRSKEETDKLVWGEFYGDTRAKASKSD